MMNHLFLEKEKWVVTLGSIADGVITTDNNGHIEYMNLVAEALTGWKLAHAAGKPAGEVFSLIDETARIPLDDIVRKCLETAVVVPLESGHLLIDILGSEYAVEGSAAPIRGDSVDVIGCIVVFRDMTPRKELMSEITRKANFDSLTHLPNRNLFHDRLDQMVAQSVRTRSGIALFYLDIDEFKDINDTMGHPFGDLLLKEIAGRIRAVVREIDTVARLGGDEFCIIADKIGSREEALLFAGKVRDHLSKPYQLEGVDLRVTTSIGVALFPEDGTTPTVLVRNADIAMYQAKGKGRNGIEHFSPEMDRAIQDRASIENRLYLALEHSEFVLFYQPIVDLQSGKMVSVEALVRWDHPEFGMIPPDRFISLAEKNGMIIPMGRWILEQACRQSKSWLEAQDLSLLVKVNVSIRQLLQADFVTEVERSLLSNGLPAERLELEITESLLMENLGELKQTLSRLKGMGVRLSIDDFGTGYSSLSYLSHLNLNTLKIDQSFTKGIGIHPNDDSIVKTILALARSLSLEVVAEGVETVLQADFLVKNGCSVHQGYLYARPQPASSIPGYREQSFSPPAL